MEILLNLFKQLVNQEIMHKNGELIRILQDSLKIHLLMLTGKFSLSMLKTELGLCGYY